MYLIYAIERFILLIPFTAHKVMSLAELNELFHNFIRDGFPAVR